MARAMEEVFGDAFVGTVAQAGGVAPRVARGMHTNALNAPIGNVRYENAVRSTTYNAGTLDQG